MTYATATLSMESFHRMDYSVAVKAEAFEDPVDLSCKKVPSPRSPASSESDKDSSVSPLRGSTYLEHHEETNNNDSKSLSSYHLHLHAQRQRKNLDKDAEKERQSQTHLCHHHHDSTSYSSSNHERKSPYENRPYVMTPPSDTSSPKKPKYQSMFEHPSPAISESHPYPSYPILPMGLGVSVPVPNPINMPSVIPGLMTPNSMSHSPIATSATAQEPARTSTPVDDTKKAPRPFKAYPKDPLSISAMGPDIMFDQEQKQAYCEFRNRMLESVKRTNEGTNIKMRRMSKSPMLPSSALDDKDAAYWERRRKNNEAAKRSRDARRAKEDEIAIRAAFLEQEFLRLKYENTLLKEENSKLSKLVYGS